MFETKLICNVPHVRVPCRGCRLGIWVKDTFANLEGTVCNDCANIPRNPPKYVRRRFRSERQYHG